MTSAYGASDALPTEEPPRHSVLDRNLAMFGYLCLFFTVLFAGLPAFVTLVLAYVRRGDVDGVTRSHLNYQIKAFWWSFWLTVLGVAALIAALVLGLAEMWPAIWLNYTEDSLPLAMPPGYPSWLMALVASALLLTWAALWTLIAPVWGGIKLAVGAPIGRL